MGTGKYWRVMWSGTCLAGWGDISLDFFFFLVAYHLIYFLLTLPLIYHHHYVPFPTGITAARSSHQSQLNKIKKRLSKEKRRRVAASGNLGLRAGSESWVVRGEGSSPWFALLPYEIPSPRLTV